MLGTQKMPVQLVGPPEDAAVQLIAHLRTIPGCTKLFEPDPSQTSILAGELVECSRAGHAGVEVPYTVPVVREVVETNRALDGSALSGANGEAERGS